MQVLSSKNITTEKDFAYVSQSFFTVRLGAPLSFRLAFHMNDGTCYYIDVYNKNDASIDGVACTSEEAGKRYIKLVNEKKYRSLIYHTIKW